MNRLLHILIHAAILALAAGLIFASCEHEEASVVTEVSVKSASVASSASAIYVNVRCASDWTLELRFEDGASPWAEITPVSGKGDKNNVQLTYEENTTRRPRTLMIIITSGKRVSNCTMTQAAAENISDGGDNGDEGNDGDDGGTCSPIEGNLKTTTWLELPAIEDRALKYFTHSFSMGGKDYRNYSFGWSQNDLVALWVAYPLNKTYTNKTTGRTDEWAYDPLLGKLSSAPFAGYGGDYARGHQLPSADRLCCVEANEQTFYGTNMTPQLNKHNEGIWSNLESKVRTWANTSDTTYVVTGCVVEGSKEFTVDSDGKTMTVPVAYYKAVLRYHKSSTISQWAAVGFYTEHKDYGSSKSDLKAVAMSIDALEEKIGLDFFPNLYAKLGKAKADEVEAQDPKTAAVWGW